MPEKTSDVAKTRPEKKLSDREILGALLRATVPQESEAESDNMWHRLRFDEGKLLSELTTLFGHGRAKPDPKRVTMVASDLASGVRLRLARVDDLALKLPAKELRLPRALVGEALGALGSEFFPNRRRARAVATSAARELAYFGCGPLSSQILPSPLETVRQQLEGVSAGKGEPVLFGEQLPKGQHDWTVFELFTLDPFFHLQLNAAPDLARFQENLRKDPLDGAMVSKLREFFSRRATIGVRDSARWALGSRHPWFDWTRAQDLLSGSFARAGQENFLCPRLVLFTEDPGIDRGVYREIRDGNARLAGLLSEGLAAALPAELLAKLERPALEEMALFALDHHFDHPDFDLEAQRRQPGETTARFFTHAASVLANRLSGRGLPPRRNRNFAAFFDMLGLTGWYLGALDEQEREKFFIMLSEQVQAAQEGYRRLPMLLLDFYAAPDPRPRPGERLLDSFTLRDLRAPQYARHLRAFPEIAEKLSVFFTLVLRHYLDTDHAPDLRPSRRLRDHWLLGLWGDCSERVRVNLYEEVQGGRVRCELRFLGEEQVKGYRPEQDRSHEGVLVRRAANLLGPSLEKGMLRTVGSFLMVVAEGQEGKHSGAAGRLALTKQTLEVFRETARTGVRGTLVDVATTLEVVLDNAVDTAQRGLDRLDRLVRRKDSGAGRPADTGARDPGKQ